MPRYLARASLMVAGRTVSYGEIIVSEPTGEIGTLAGTVPPLLVEERADGTFPEPAPAAPRGRCCGG